MKTDVGSNDELDIPLWQSPYQKESGQELQLHTVRVCVCSYVLLLIIQYKTPATTAHTRVHKSPSMKNEQLQALARKKLFNKQKQSTKN